MLKTYIKLPELIKEIHVEGATYRNSIHYELEEIKENKEGKENGKT